MRIVLFDIDGTLVSTLGAGMRAIFKSLEESYGKPFPGKTWEAAGKTDYLILREMSREMGIHTRDFEASYPALRSRYLNYLEKNLAGSRPLVMPGIHELLDKLDKEAIPVGLLTGNFRDGARLKLEAAGLWNRFRFGAYGDGVDSRDELPEMAKKAIQEDLGRSISMKEIILIGDTPRDVACARAGGCAILAVATGSHSREQLKATGTPHVVQDLSDTDACMALLLA